MCSTTSGDTDGKGLGEGFLQQRGMGEVQSCIPVRASILRTMSRSWSDQVHGGNAGEICWLFFLEDIWLILSTEIE